MLKFIHPIILACTVLAAPAFAQGNDQTTTEQPWRDRPEAADQTLGMALMSATVAGDGTLILGTGVDNVVRHSVGNYSVFFNRSLVGCTHVASPSNSGGSIAHQRLIGSAAPWTEPEQLRVITINSITGNEVDNYFSAIVFCPQ